MAVRGQRPKSAHLKLVTGDPGHRGADAAAVNEPQPDGEVVKPSFVKGKAAKIWDELAPMAMSMGTLKSIDARLFGKYCRLCVQIEDDEVPAALITQWRVIGEQFGVGPAARARIGLDLGKHTKRDGQAQAEKPAAVGGSRYFKD